MKLFDALLRKLIRKGTLTVIDANGNRYRYGEASDVARVTIRFTDPATPWHASFNPSLELGEAHRDGRMLVEEGDITAFLKPHPLGRRRSGRIAAEAPLAAQSPFGRVELAAPGAPQCAHH